MALELHDTPERYGAVTRALHWGMAALFAWQFLGMILKVILDEHPIVGVVAGSHSSTGLLIFLLALARVIWTFVNPSRPPREPGPVGHAAQAGHSALYALMLLVPGIALLRAYGSGRGIAFFGIELVAETGREVEWMMAPANALHGLLGWTLLVLILGHVAMAIAHRYLWGDDVFVRMRGNTASASS